MIRAGLRTREKHASMSTTEQVPSSAPAPQRPWYRRIGPGLITACVVIGPGSILTSSKTGAANGYAMAWVVVVAIAFMMVYTTLAARLGVVTGESAGNLVARRAGRWLAVLIGAGVFFISAAFQFGNNLGVASAFEVFVGKERTLLLIGIVVLFNGVSIAFLFAFRSLYKAVERLMATFVGIMLTVFAVNLFFAEPDPGDLAAGFVPFLSAGHTEADGNPMFDISVLGLIGTTFVITAAYFQSYLVRQKGWGHAEMRDGLLDARVGTTIMALVTLMIMSTAAAEFHDFLNGRPARDLAGVADVAQQLKPSIGRHAQVLFCLGLFSAAYSSFLVNSMIGGYILSDGLGLGDGANEMAPKLFTTAVLVTGMGVALYVVSLGAKPVPAIVAAQAVTVVAAPLMAGALLWLTNSPDVMGEDRNGPLMNVLAGLGFLILLAMAWYTAAVRIPDQIRDWRDSGSAAVSPEGPEAVSRTLIERRPHVG